MVKNTFNRSIHDKALLCPRPRCRAQNAPKGSAEFGRRCWNCKTYLTGPPVDRNDEVVIDIYDIHSNGCGLGRTEDGFIILIDGVLPDARVKACITDVRDTYAYAEEIERLDPEAAEDEDVSQDAKGEEETNPLGSRENFWGSD